MSDTTDDTNDAPAANAAPSSTTSADDQLVTNSMFAADMHNQDAGQNSLFDTVGNLFTKAAPLIGLSIANSFANTGIEVANWFGADVDKIGIQDEVDDPDYLKYYQQHSQGIEGAGLLVGAFLPGGLAVKGAEAGVKAVWLAKLGLSTEQMARATGILAPLRSSIVERGLQEVASGAELLEQLTPPSTKL